MAVELKIAALGALLLFIHIFVAIRYKTAQYGRAWNVSARDETLPVGIQDDAIMVGRARNGRIRLERDGSARDGGPLDPRLPPTPQIAAVLGAWILSAGDGDRS